jgi:BASS family bile acid:Na+ symporter
MDYVSAAQASSLGGHVTFNVGSLIMQNVVLMLLPIVLGLLSQRYLPNFSKKADSVLRKIAFPALMLLAGIFFVQHRETIIANFGEVGLVNSTMFLGATVAAALLCLLFRFSGAVRKTIVIEVGMQNAAQAIAVASSPFVFNNDMIAVPAIVYALLMNVFLLSYVAIANQLSKD